MTTADPHSSGPTDDAATSHWLFGFRRITSSGRFIPEIDGLRFIAIMMVVLYHALVFVCISKDLGVGHIENLARAVEMFFVLSGFILAVPFAAQYLRASRRVKLKDYFLRRVTRLEPPYLLCIAIYAVLKYIQLPTWRPVMLRNVLLDSFYLHGTVLGRWEYIVSVAWSLEVEVQFYLLMPLLAMVFLIRPTTLRRVVMIAAIFLPPIVQPIWIPAKLLANDAHILNSIQYFFAGILLADVWVVEWNNTSPSIESGSRWWCDLAWLALFPLILFVPRDRQYLDRFWLAPVVLILYLLMFRSVWIRKLMRVQFVTLIGGMCYSIYLVHNLAISAIGRLVSPHLPYVFWRAAIVSALVLIPTSLLVSTIYFRLIERPCMRRKWPQRLWGWFASRLFVEEEPVRTA